MPGGSTSPYSQLKGDYRVILVFSRCSNYADNYSALSEDYGVVCYATERSAFIIPARHSCLVIAVISRVCGPRYGGGMVRHRIVDRRRFFPRASAMRSDAALDIGGYHGLYA